MNQAHDVGRLERFGDVRPIAGRQRRVAIGGAARRTGVGRRGEVARGHSVSLMPTRGGQRITVPRCGVLSVSCVKLLIAAWRAKKRSRTLANRNALVPWKAS